MMHLLIGDRLCKIVALSTHLREDVVAKPPLINVMEMNDNTKAVGLLPLQLVIPHILTGQPMHLHQVPSQLNPIGLILGIMDHISP